MKKLIRYSVLGLLCLNFPVFAASFEPLKIGDILPDMTLSNMVNYPGSSIRTADLKGKYLILDFWATWCSSCIAKFPEAASIEEEFGDRIQIVAVAYEPTAKIQKFFRSPAGQRFGFPSVTADTILSKLFPHRTVPHYVWIDPQGKVFAMTGGEEFNIANVRKAVNGQRSLAMQVKKDLNTDKPLFLSEDYPADNPIMAYTILSKGSYSGLPSGGKFRQKGRITYGRALTNATLLHLFEDAAFFVFDQHQERFSKKRTVLEVTDTASVRALTATLWNFEFSSPIERADSLWSDMLAELSRVTGFDGQIICRSQPCLVLTTVKGSRAPVTKGRPQKNTLFDAERAELLNAPVAYLTTRIDALPQLMLPVLDETGITENIDICFDHRPEDLDDLNRMLGVYGLQLSPAERKIRMLVIRSKKTLQNPNQLKPD